MPNDYDRYVEMDREKVTNHGISTEEIELGELVKKINLFIIIIRRQNFNLNNLQ